jgi:hypothetical protein
MFLTNISIRLQDYTRITVGMITAVKTSKHNINFKWNGWVDTVGKENPFDSLFQISHQ